MRPKYGNHKIKNAYGTYDSQLEFARFIFLSNREKEGEITNLRRQVEYLLIPAQYGTEIKHLKTKDKEVRVLLERSCSYVADFVSERNGGTIVTVSYTPLRAHETVIDLVCRLLLDKKTDRKMKYCLMQ